jgi:hypothetical protein
MSKTTVHLVYEVSDRQFTAAKVDDRRIATSVTSGDKSSESLHGDYVVVYADPPWQYDFAESPDRREIEGQYPTMTIEQIKKYPKLPKAKIEAPNRNGSYCWTTVSVGVPTRLIFPAIGQCLRIHFEKLEILE